MGLAGTSGILPSHYTQLLIDRVREKDFGLQDFLDLFNHRSIAQFYRAWEKCHFYVGYESSRRGGAKDADRFTQMLLSLVGMGTAGLQGRQAISDEVLVYYAGHFSHRPRSAVALEQIVSDAFRGADGDSAVPGPMDVSAAGGPDATPPRRNNRLGVSAIAGRRVWGIENKDSGATRGVELRGLSAFMPGATGYVVPRTDRALLCRSGVRF